MKHDPASAAAVSPRLMKFVWEDRIPRGHITLIGGWPSRGKSLITYEIAADIGGPVVFASLEEVKATTWRPRLEAADADLAQMFLVNGIRISPDPSDLRFLRDTIVGYGAKLLVVDPITNHMRASIRVDQKVRESLEPAREILEEHNCAMLIVSHLLKSASPKAHPLASFGGATGGITGLAKAVYAWGPDPFGDPDVDRVLADADKFNFGQRRETLAFTIRTAGIRMQDPDTKRRVTSRVPYLVPTGVSDVTAKDVLMYERGVNADSSGTVTRGTPKLDLAIAALTEEMAEKGQITAARSHELAREIGVSNSILRVAADRTGVRREKRKWITGNGAAEQGG